MTNPKRNLDSDWTKLGGRYDIIYLNSHLIDICETCVKIGEKPAVKHGYLENYNGIYFIKLDENLRPGSPVELSIRYYSHYLGL